MPVFALDIHPEIRTHFSRPKNFDTPMEKVRNNLPRLADCHYLGRNPVHWIQTTAQRATGWLTDAFHARFREVLCHAAARYSLSCPIYCLMPDHIHMLWVGESDETDQRKAIDFWRRQLKNSLPGIGARSPGGVRQPFWQRQVYDHVLRESERERGPFNRWHGIP